MTNEKDLERKSKEIEEKLRSETAEPVLKTETDKWKYELLKSDGVQLSHTGWFVATDEKMNISELFYAYSRKKSKDKEIEIETIEPYVLIFEYDKDGKILSKTFKPLNELAVIELGEVVAQIKKKSIAESSLPTQIDLETVVQLLSDDNIKVDLAELYTRIKQKVQYYIYFGQETYYELATLWIIGTYFSDVFKVYPNLFILGPSGSGKTRLTKLITYISRRGWMIIDPTDANLPRVIEGYRPTIGLDDFDVIMRRHFPIVLSLLKHTYKESVQIPRIEKVLKGEKFLLSLFSPFAPLVANSTEPIEETQLLMRQIRIDMPKNVKLNFPRQDPDIYFTEKERKELYIARFLLAPIVYKIFNSIDTGLKGRDDEIWSPLLTIAKLISEDLFKRIRDFAIKESRQKETELYNEEKLIIQAIESIIGSEETLEFTAGELLDKIKAILIDNKELTEKQFEKEWTTRKLGRILERMHIESKRTGKKRLRTVKRETLDKLKETYGYDISDISDVNTGTPTNSQSTNFSQNNGDIAENKQKSEDSKPVGCPIETSLTSLTSQPSRKYSSKTFFLRLPEGYHGKCSHCSEDIWIEWIDSNGNHLCDECKKEEEENE